LTLEGCSRSDSTVSRPLSMQPPASSRSDIRATLTVGAQEGEFEITVRNDTDVPWAVLKYPPAYTLVARDRTGGEIARTLQGSSPGSVIPSDWVLLQKGESVSWTVPFITNTTLLTHFPKGTTVTATADKTSRAFNRRPGFARVDGATVFVPNQVRVTLQ
jgi:hypothetical protein